MMKNTKGNTIKKHWRKIFPVLLLAVLVFAVFLRGAAYPFLIDWDDCIFITINPLLAPTLSNFLHFGTHTFQDLYTPLPMWSFMLDKMLFGLEPLGFRLVNYLWHITASIFLLLIARGLGVRPLLAFAAALLWAVSPQKVESVVWITERKDVLCGAFAFASVYFFLRSFPKEKVPVLATVCALLALLAKPAATPLPGVMIVCVLCIWWTSKPFSAYFKVLALPVTASAALILWSARITAEAFPGGMETRLLFPLHNLLWYPATALLPFELSPMYPNIDRWEPHIPFLIISAAALASAVFGVWKLGIRGRKLAALLLVIGGTMVPVLGLVSYTAMDYCDRYNYLVSAAVWVSVALALNRVPRKFPEYKRLVTGTLVLYFCMSAFMTIHYIPVWRHCDELFIYAIRNGRPANHAAIENSAMSAVKSNNSGLLRELADVLEEDFKNRSNDDVHLIHTALFFRAHADAISGRGKEAWENYSKLALLTRSGQLELMRPNAFLPVLFRGASSVATAVGRFDDAALFFQEYFRVKKQKGAEYYWMAARKAALENNTAARKEALENLVKLNKNPSFRRELEALK